MSAYNVVRFRVKPGQEDRFVQAHRAANTEFPGFRHGSLIRTGERTYCFIGEWDAQKNIDDAEPDMVKVLDQFRDTLEDLGGDLGVTDPVAGEVIVDITH